jgi:hypothetical protein
VRLRKLALLAIPGTYYTVRDSCLYLQGSLRILPPWRLIIFINRAVRASDWDNTGAQSHRYLYRSTLSLRGLYLHCWNAHSFVRMQSPPANQRNCIHSPDNVMDATYTVGMHTVPGCPPLDPRPSIQEAWYQHIQALAKLYSVHVTQFTQIHHHHHPWLISHCLRPDYSRGHRQPRF